MEAASRPGATETGILGIESDIAHRPCKPGLGFLSLLASQIPDSLSFCSGIGLAVGEQAKWQKSFSRLPSRASKRVII